MTSDKNYTHIENTEITTAIQDSGLKTLLTKKYRQVSFAG